MINLVLARDECRVIPDLVVKDVIGFCSGDPEAFVGAFTPVFLFHAVTCLQIGKAVKHHGD